MGINKKYFSEMTVTRDIFTLFQKMAEGDLILLTQAIQLHVNLTIMLLKNLKGRSLLTISM